MHVGTSDDGDHLYAKAREWYERSATNGDASAAGTADVRNSIAWQFFRAGQAAAGSADADRAIALEPNSAHYLDTRGHIRLALGQVELAFADFDKAIGNGAEFPGAYYGRGQCHEANRRIEAAIADYGKALELKFDDSDEYERDVQTKLRDRLKALGVEVPEGKPEPK